MGKFTSKEKMMCAQREVARRWHVEMTAVLAAHVREIEMMREIAEDYRLLAEQGELGLPLGR